LLSQVDENFVRLYKFLRKEKKVFTSSKFDHNLIRKSVKTSSSKAQERGEGEGRRTKERNELEERRKKERKASRRQSLVI
jgi:hypothetical protein